jgi:hypothetical protein
MAETKIRVILQKSFEFNITELTGKDIDEKTKDAVEKARTRMDQLLKFGKSKVLLEDKIIVKPRT